MTLLAVDLSKLLNAAYSTQKAKDMSQSDLKTLISSIAGAGQDGDDGPIVAVAYKLFKHFVVFERGVARSHVLSVIKDRIWPLMDSKERVSLFSAIVLEFLSRTAGGYSQKSVVEALDSLTIPAGDLIWFLSQRLGLQSDTDPQGKSKTEKLAPERPLVMVSSILVLALQQIQRVESRAAEDGSAGRWAVLGM